MKCLEALDHGERARTKSTLSLEYLIEWITAVIVWVLVYALDQGLLIKVYQQMLHIPSYLLQNPNITELIDDNNFKVDMQNEFDPGLAKDFRTETVSQTNLLLVSILAPVGVSCLVQAGYLILNQKRHWRWHFDLYILFLTVVQAVGFALLFTVGVKISTGRFRPDFYARLSRVANGISDDSHELLDGQFSYSSGHSAASFASMTTLSLYMFGKSRLFSARHQNDTTKPELYKSLKFLKLVLIGYTLMGYASYVGVTRITDHRHNYSDVNAGAGIGIMCAVSVYFLHFRSLTDNYCEYPRGVDAQFEEGSLKHAQEMDFKQEQKVGDSENIQDAKENIEIVTS